MIPGGWEWLIILAVVVLLFGGKKLPQLGGAIGESIKNFKKGVKDNSAELEGESEAKDADKDV
mgnify:CR=1 FL=1